MDGQQLVATVREEQAAALSRLGSDKYLVAATGADLDTGPVLLTLARAAANARDVFESWAEEDVGDPASAFERAAETERDHYERVVAAMPESGDGASIDAAADDPAAVETALTASENTIERIGAGLIGRPLVADRTLLQVVNFFVNEADEKRADLARDLRSDSDARLDGGMELLDDRCDSGDDWERARRGAERVIVDAYDEYAAALESMGVDPKPVC